MSRQISGLILNEPLDSQESGWIDMTIKTDETAHNVFRPGLNEVERAEEQRGKA